MDRRWGDDALRPLAPGHPWLEGLGKVGYRNVMGLRRNRLRPRLEAVTLTGRPAIIYSRYDLTCGLLGNPNPLIAGLDGDAAHEVLSRLLLAAAGVKPK